MISYCMIGTLFRETDINVIETIVPFDMLCTNMIKYGMYNGRFVILVVV